ncbi:MAG: 2-C-methyl-D-erythritol 2,4-cyclodiphosphate synthase [Acidobacteria bacterium]|jgi:2-C-methyl-D-erythritol 2,4-cyclodiphosphate synthase|nr:MAG: 2-C-methyl-D-erythritol 2,4-cyclodiphosphate synthase [Acidobacteriota bacterium]
MRFRIGFGNDIHRLVAGRPLILGGVLIPSDIGAAGHSDADALMHAITDAILGALALGDIGTHFPDSDQKLKNADSSIFLKETLKMMKSRNYQIENVDAIVSLEKPKLKPYIEKIRKNLAEILEVELDRVSVKAKTGEGLDAIGKGDAIKAEAIVLLTEKPNQ